MPDARAVVGQPAPDFMLKGVDGQALSLSEFRGKTVVLEWFNPDCPFVKLAHGEGPLPAIAKRHLKNGGVWLAINSGAPGKQGHGARRNLKARGEYGMGYPILLDASGAVGRAYGATNTPQVYIVDAKGILVYAGAIDDTGGGGYDRGPFVNYLRKSLESISNGQKPGVTETKPWGCSVKYSN